MSMHACSNLQQRLEDTADSGARDVGPKGSAEEQDEALYTQVLDGLCALATDPAPRVCRRGEAALKLSNVELHPLSPSGGALVDCTNLPSESPGNALP